MRLSAGRFVVSIDGVSVAQVPARRVRALTLGTGAHVTTPAIRFLLKQGAPITFNDGRGRPIGHAMVTDIASPDRLRAQLLADDETRTSIARAIVRERLAGMARVLARWKRDADAQSAGRQIDRLAARSHRFDDVERLRGLEGVATRAYYAGLRSQLHAFGFSIRNRRPPRDPVNAAWGYAAAVLRSRVELAVRAAGLHPEVGFLHAESRRNPALALDLMEEFRAPLVDVIVIDAFTSEALHPTEHFEDVDQGILLNAEGRKCLIGRIETRYQEPVAAARPASREALVFSAAIERQVAKLTRALETKRSYVPFSWNGRS